MVSISIISDLLGLEVKEPYNLVSVFQGLIIVQLMLYIKA